MGLLLTVRSKSDEMPAEVDPWHAVLRDPDGIVHAYGARSQRDGWISVPHIARFRFSLQDDEIDAFPVDSASEALVLDAYYGTALPLILQARGLEALHASAIESASGVTAFCAISGVGKSTFAQALRARGHPVWADDVVVIEPTRDAGPICHRLPSIAELELKARGADETMHTGKTEDVAPLAAIALLRRNGGGGRDVDIHRLPISAALVRVLEHAHFFEPSDKERQRSTSANYLALVGDVPVFEVSFRPGHRHFRSVLEAVERTVLSAS